MFAVFALYILTFLAFYLTRWSWSRGALFAGAFLLTVFAAAFVYWLIWAGKPGYFYNTVLLFPFGCWYSLCKKWIDAVMLKSETRYFLVCAVTMVLYALMYKIRGNYGIEGYTVWAVVFTLTIVWFTMKISVANPVLDWFGSHVFSVYILQRIPMMIFSYFGLGHSHRYFFFVMSIVSTIFLSHIFDTVMGKIYSKKDVRRRNEV
jgi:hypothetical protein